MIVYSSTKSRFRSDVMSNDIGGIILKTFETRTGRSTGKSEIDSWINSLQYMDRVLEDNEIPGDAGVAIEYHIPQTSKRIDFILTGKDRESRDTAVLIELKQWETAERTDQDAVVITRFKHGEKQTLHPSYQAWSYKRLLEDFNQTVQEEQIQLYPCAYLHNYEADDCITHECYADYLAKAPAFLKNDALKLQAFIKQHVRYGDKDQILYRIDHGKIKPSKNLADQLASMLQGNQEFTLVDDQKIVYETALTNAARATLGRKQVLIVEGGPGTGKSVVAINLLVAVTGRELVVQYVTRNSAPRLVYEAKLTGSMKKSHISNLFSGSGSFHSVDINSFDCLIVDEAHRLNEKSGMFSHLGENQIGEIIRASRSSVFFIDEAQKVTLKDIGDKEEIRRWARKENANVTELTLESQFRCNGSDGYLAWIDDVLQIRKTANTTLDENEYDFRIFDTPEELHDWIRLKNQANNKARMVAGYCWDWASQKQKNPNVRDIVIGKYQATWNLTEHGQAWIIHSESVSEVGCIHTCQGLELDYVGVIVGEDFVLRDGRAVTQPEKRSSMDKSIHGWRKLMKQDPKRTAARLEAIIKNTYRTLMTRGQKGCYVYFVDEETRRYFETRLGVFEPEIVPYENALPLLSIRAAADAQYASLQGAFSENITWQRIVGGPFPEDRFLVRAEGNSMEPLIQDGQLCVFRKDPGGTRNNRIVLCRIGGFAGDEPAAVIKRYRSARARSADSIGEAKAIVLSSENPDHEDIVLTGDEELSILGVFDRVID